jgi:hypothetical protein
VEALQSKPQNAVDRFTERRTGSTGLTFQLLKDVVIDVEGGAH